jgi:hypothetical protein
VIVVEIAGIVCGLGAAVLEPRYRVAGIAGAVVCVMALAFGVR